MREQYLVIGALLVTAILTACGKQTVLPTLEPATATSISVPPSQTPAATEAPPTATTSPTASLTDVPATEGVSFAIDVMPIFQNSCNKCHGDEETKKGLDMRTYTSLMSGSFSGAVIKPGDANSSLLIKQILEGRMPKRGQKLPEDQIQVIVDWVNAGAINN